MGRSDIVHKPEVVVITGASGGVGRATVRAFAKRGAHIGLLARGHDGLAGARQEVEAAGGKALVLPTDVADAGQVEVATETVEREFGPIDIWVNDAMTSVFSPIKEMTAEEFQRVTEVCYLGFVHGTCSALHRMLPRDHGVIVQVGSALAYRSIPLQAAYCASKAAIRGFTDSLRCELIHEKSNVRVTMVQMPALNTPQFDWVKSRLPHKAQPVPPIYQPEIAAEAIYWAAHHKRREVHVGWSTQQAIWGTKFFPGLLDRYLGLTGYAGQQTDEPATPDQPSNLWNPVDNDRDFGAHGRFDNRSRTVSAELWVTEHQDWLLAGVAGIASVAGIAALARRGA